MLVIEVELLAGRYAATEHNDRRRAEWPPHPARFYSALVAALHDGEPVDVDETEALLWLENQGAPFLDVDLNVTERVGRREVHGVFVPVNDVTLVGNPEKELRELLYNLAVLQEQEQTKKVSAEIKKIRKVVEGERTKLARFVAEQQHVDTNAPLSAVLTASALIRQPKKIGTNRIGFPQQRTFPVIIPERTVFAFLWPDAEPQRHLEALHRLCGRVTRIGHSSSLVRCAIVERAVEATLVPQADGEHVLRVVGPGQLQRLQEAYLRHQAFEPRVLPARPQRYGKPVREDPRLPHSVFTKEWIVFERIGGQRPLASRSSDLAIALRRALIEINGKEDLPPMLSGHDADNLPSVVPHAAFVPLPWVGHEYADGSMQGLSIILPRSIPSADRERLLRLIARWEGAPGDPDEEYAVELHTPASVGSRIMVRLRRVELPSKVSLDASRWCKPSRKFVTATPIALDRHPGNLRSNLERAAHKAATEAESSVADACERIGLPRPSKVSISLAPLIPGAQHVRQFAPWPPQPNRPRRARVHAEIEFAEKVHGPVLLGAARYFGLGLCLPVADFKGIDERGSS